MPAGERYKDSDPELVAERRRAQVLVDRFNATTSDQQTERHAVLTELLGAIGDGVAIGDNAVIGAGAGAVVTRDVPAKVFAAGNPCRVIREL